MRSVSHTAEEEEATYQEGNRDEGRWAVALPQGETEALWGQINEWDLQQKAFATFLGVCMLPALSSCQTVGSRPHDLKTHPGSKKGASSFADLFSIFS